MNFVADEGIDAQIVARLRIDGHQVWYVAEMLPGVPDTAVLNLSTQEDALLLTADKDFGDLVFRQQRVSRGLVLLRLHGLPPDRKADIVTHVVQMYSQQLAQAFTVVTEQKVRIRPSKQAG